MNRSTRRAVVLGCLIALAACGPQSSTSSPAASSMSEATMAAAPARCGPGPLDSALALRSKGGGCTPFDLGTINALNAALAGDTTALLKGLEQLSAVNPEWAPVVNGGAGPLSMPVLLHGTVLDSHLSTTDFPSTHVSIDQNTDILLDDEDAGCAATGNATAELEGGPDPRPHIELEWETSKYPAWAWAGPGDRIVTLGRWIFDCGHEDAVPGLCHGSSVPCILDTDCAAGVGCEGTVFNYHSELHPPQAVAVIRAGRGALISAGGGNSPTTPLPVTRADVFVSGDGGGAGDACVLTPVATLPELLSVQDCFPFSEPLAPINGFDFTFDVDLPDVPHGGAPFWRIEQQSDLAPAVSADIQVEPVLAPGTPHLHVTVLMTKRVAGGLPTGFAGTLLGGWRQANVPPLEHVRVTIEGIEMSDPLAHPFPVPNAHAWRVEAAVNGEWQRFVPDVDVSGDSFPRFFPVNLVFDQWLPPNGTLTVHAQGESEGCEDFVRGQPLRNIIGTFAQEVGPDDALLFAAICNFDTEIDDGEIDASFAGPQFGVQVASHVVPSAHGVWSLKFRIEQAAGAGAM